MNSSTRPPRWRNSNIGRYPLHRNGIKARPCSFGSLTARQDHAEGDDPFGIEWVIGKIGLRNRFEIKLLPLRFETCRLERGERGSERLFCELAAERQALVLAQRRDDRVALSAELGTLFCNQIVERGDPRLDQRDLWA